MILSTLYTAQSAALASRPGLLAEPPPQEPPARPLSPGLRRILVAVDGTAASAGALRVAARLAWRHRSAIDVVSVLLRWGRLPDGSERFDTIGELLAARLERLLRLSEGILRRVPWTLRISGDGDVATAIAAAARADRHDLIVTGSARHWTTRWLRRPTALAVARIAPVPVLAVPAEFDRLPSRAIVALNGREPDLDAVFAAADVLEERGVVYGLANAPSSPGDPPPGLALDGARLTESAHIVEAELVACELRPAAQREARSVERAVRRVMHTGAHCVLLSGPGAVSWVRRAG